MLSQVVSVPRQAHYLANMRLEDTSMVNLPVSLSSFCILLQEQIFAASAEVLIHSSLTLQAQCLCHRWALCLRQRPGCLSSVHALQLAVLYADAVPVLVLALSANAETSTFRSTAEAAFSVLQKLLAKEDAPADVWEATEVALLRMKAVPCLCKFLEPEGADWSVEVEAKRKPLLLCCMAWPCAALFICLLP